MGSIPLPCSTAALFQPTSLIWDSEESSPVERRPPANQKWMLEARKPRIGNPPALTCRLAMGLHRQRRGPYRKPNGREAARGRLSAVFVFCESEVCKKFIYNSQKNHLDSIFFCGMLFRKQSTGTVPVRGSCRARAKHRTCAILPKGGDIPCAFTSGRSCPIRPISTI